MVARKQNPYEQTKIELPLDIALSLLRPDEIEKLRRYCFCVIVMAGFKECTSLSFIQRERKTTSIDRSLREHTYNAWAFSKDRTIPAKKLQLSKGTHATLVDKDIRECAKIKERQQNLTSSRQTAGDARRQRTA